MKNTLFPLALLLFGVRALAQDSLPRADRPLRCPVLDIAANDSFLFAATACGLLRLPQGADTWQKPASLPKGGANFVAAWGKNVVVVQHWNSGETASGSDSLRFFKSRDNGKHFFLKSERALNMPKPPASAGMFVERNHIGRMFQLADSMLLLAGTHTVGSSEQEFSNFAGCFSPDGGETWAWESLPKSGERVVGTFPAVAAKGDSLAIFTHDRFYVTRDLSQKPSLFADSKFEKSQVQTDMAWAEGRAVLAFSDGSLAVSTDGVFWASEKPGIGVVADLFFHKGQLFACSDQGFFRGNFAGARLQFAPIATLPAEFSALRKAVPLRGGHWMLLSEGRALFLDTKTGEVRIIW